MAIRIASASPRAPSRWVAAFLVVALALLASSAKAQDDFGGLPLPGDEPPVAPMPGVIPAPAAAPAPAAPPAGVAPFAQAAPIADAASTGVPAITDGGTADEAFGVRTKQLEEQVNDLKEKIFHSKRRLLQLQEAVIGVGVMSGAKLALWHRNELGSSYILTAVAYTLDGAPLYTKVDETGGLNEIEEWIIYDQRAVPGQHLIAVQYELRGHGYGIFSYLEGMRVKARASYQFNVEPGKITTVKGILKEKDGITLEFRDKPTIEFAMTVQKDVAKPVEEPDAAAASEPQAAAGGGTK